jgi:hypothetical protein
MLLRRSLCAVLPAAMLLIVPSAAIGGRTLRHRLKKRGGLDAW